MVEDLDETFGRPVSADLLATLKGQHWLVEVRYAGGAPKHTAVDDVRRHLRGWHNLGREENLEGSIFIVNHPRQRPPHGAPLCPVPGSGLRDALESTVIGTLALYRWGANGALEALVPAVCGPPRQHAAPEPPEDKSTFG